jgi:outer membrane scaffolding protein for murein synthesis (MipA/OmpV family)
MHRDMTAVGFGGAALAVAVLAFAGQAHAIDWTIGLGAALAPDYEGSDDYEAVPNWLLSANNLYDPNTFVRITGPELRSNFVPHPQMRAGLWGKYVPERDDVDNNRVDDLDNTDLSVLLGATVGWDLFPQPAITLAPTLDAGFDVANGNGYLISPRLSYFNALPESKFSVGAELFTTYADDDYMQEYFGIGRRASARSGLDTYDADEGFKDFGFGGTATYSFTDHWSTTLAAQYKRMLGDAEDSPIVSDEGNENQFLAAFTINYKF